MAELATLPRPAPARVGASVDTNVLIIGAGPAGLATAHALRERNVPFRIVERGPAVAHIWRNLYDSLRLHTGKHLSTLPGLRFPRATPLFPSRSDFIAYLERYRDAFEIAVETGIDVQRAEPPHNGEAWQIETSAGPLRAHSLVMATGIVSNPAIPSFPGQARFEGQILHSVDYRRPDPFIGQRVLVVGCGNSGGEIGSELARAGAFVTLSVRSGANVVPLALFGVPIQYLSWLVRKLPRRAQDAVVAAVGRLTEMRRGPPVLPKPAHSPLDAIPLIGFHLVDAIRDGLIRVRPAIEAFTESGVRFADGEAQAFDSVILATGFRAALQPLDRSVRVDARGFAMRSDRVTSADQPRLWYVGQNYDSTGGLRNIAHDAGLVAAAITHI